VEAHPPIRSQGHGRVSRSTAWKCPGRTVWRARLDSESPGARSPLAYTCAAVTERPDRDAQVDGDLLVRTTLTGKGWPSHSAGVSRPAYPPTGWRGDGAFTALQEVSGPWSAAWPSDPLPPVATRRRLARRLGGSFRQAFRTPRHCSSRAGSWATSAAPCSTGLVESPSTCGQGPHRSTRLLRMPIRTMAWKRSAGMLRSPYCSDFVTCFEGRPTGDRRAHRASLGHTGAA